MNKALEMRAPVGSPGARSFWTVCAIVIALALFVQAWIVVQARPQDLVTGAHGMADIISRAMPPAFDQFVPNVTPAKPLYVISRAVIGVTRAVPDLVWALLFVTAVGLGPFPGALALAVHSVGMLGRLFAEVIEDMDMGPVEALTLTGAGRLQVLSHAVVPGVLPSLLGIGLFRFDENLRSSLVLGFVGAGGIGFQLLTAMNLFQYQTVSFLLIATFLLVACAERVSAWLRGLVM
jgi:phosphonate transport system permease protein